ncbi:MAG: four helix bundle protein [Acidobacteriota bacterium]|nr:four helix bundle protein [Acidobacteriota bacterium]
MAFQKFEDIVAWQKARDVNKLIYSVTSENCFARDFALRDQIRRSSISIMANIAEGFGRHSNKEFANFLNIARGSAFEVQSHLYVAFDLAYISEPGFRELHGSLDEICRMLYALRKRLLV